MLGPRFSLKSLIGAMTFVSLALASLLQPWRNWGPALMLTGMLAILLLSVPAAIYTRDRVRAYYVGFATVGWGYFLLAYSPWFEGNVSRQLLANPIAESICFAVTNSLGDSLYFVQVSHVLSMFVLAYLGGLITTRFYVNSVEQSSARERIDSPTPDETSSIHSKELSLKRVQ